ncbi:hypothetical protein SGRIM128S_01429 [Streptomyces griseomycini]
MDKALEDVRTGTSRLHETALMIQTRLEEGTPDESAARLVQRRIADAEIAAERLGLLLLSAGQTRRHRARAKEKTPNSTSPAETQTSSHGPSGVPAKLRRVSSRPLARSGS